MRLGDARAAWLAASRSIEKFEVNPAAYAIRAQALNRLRDYPAAQRDAETALRWTQDAGTYQTLAWSLFKQGRYREALDAVNKAIAANPHSALGYAIRAYVEEALGRRDALLADIRRAAALNPAFDLQRRLAEAGKPIYDPNAEDLSLIPTALAQAGGDGRFPWERILEGLFFAAAILIPAFFVFRRKQKTGSWIAAFTPLPAMQMTTEPSWVGKYELGRVIGRGGMGVVYEATDHSLGRTVAIKKMSDTVAGLGEAQRRKFIQEARTVASLHHRGIVDIYDILEEQDAVYLVFEFVRGKTAHELLGSQGRLKLSQAISILRPVCKALEFAHSKGFVHRDIKPMNIIVEEDGEAKLMDFGIARLLTGPDGKPDIQKTQTVLGTPVYMAPECWQGVVRKESDVYSLGVTLYELVTGALPFKIPTDWGAHRTVEPASRTTPSLPAALDAVLERALDPDPDKRIRSAADFLARLEAAAR